MKDRIETWHPEPWAGGTYSVWDAIEEERIWATRKMAKRDRTDDVLFEYFGNSADFQAEGCTVKGTSRT